MGRKQGRTSLLTLSSRWQTNDKSQASGAQNEAHGGHIKATANAKATARPKTSPQAKGKGTGKWNLSSHPSPQPPKGKGKGNGNGKGNPQQTPNTAHDHKARTDVPPKHRGGGS